MKTKLLIIATLLFFAEDRLNAQQLTYPQVEGHPNGTPINTSFPFSITGVPFSKIPNSVWYPGKSQVVATLHMSYYWEGDNTAYMSKTTKSVTVSLDGSWAISNLTVDAPPYPIPGKNPAVVKAEYLLYIFHQYGGKTSDGWNTIIYRKIKREQMPIKNRIRDPKLKPVIVHPKDKHSLNPQPAPPRQVGKLKSR